MLGLLMGGLGLAPKYRLHFEISSLDFFHIPPCAKRGEVSPQGTEGS